MRVRVGCPRREAEEVPKVPKVARIMEVLRTCVFCGAEAHNEADLDKFRKKPQSVHGRENVCKPCYNIRQRNHGYRQKRWHKLVDGFPKPVRCTHCGSLVLDLEGSRKPGGLAIHSVDGDHENWDPLNKEPMHVRCHSSFHNAGEKNPRYKGETAK